MKLRHTRRIIDAIHNGELGRAEYATTPIFNLHIPRAVTDVPDNILTPEQQWSDKAAFDKVRHWRGPVLHHGVHGVHGKAANLFGIPHVSPLRCKPAVTSLSKSFVDMAAAACQCSIVGLD